MAPNASSNANALGRSLGKMGNTLQWPQGRWDALITTLALGEATSMLKTRRPLAATRLRNLGQRSSNMLSGIVEALNTPFIATHPGHINERICQRRRHSVHNAQIEGLTCPSAPTTA